MTELSILLTAEIAELKAQLLAVTLERDGERKRWERTRKLISGAFCLRNTHGYVNSFSGGMSFALSQIDKVAGEVPDLGDAGMDTKRLDWLITILWVIEMDHRGWYMRDSETDEIIAGFWKTPREAIDAAIAATISQGAQSDGSATVVNSGSSQKKP